jgi:hypothetical protein
MRPWFSAVVSAAFFIACGSRTGLLVPGEQGFPDGDTSPMGNDSGEMALDAGPDATEVSDALPPIDVTAPVDAFNDCPDAGATLVYVVTKQEQLLSFYPPTAQFRDIGPLSCPTSDPGATPFSMAVDRTGIAYVVYSDGELFRVSTANGHCQTTLFQSGQSGFAANFGMGFSHNNTGTGETLFVASGGPGTPSLATIDPRTFTLRIVGNLQPAIMNAELTGTGAGDLFAFFATSSGTPCDNMATNVSCIDSAIAQLDKTTGRVVAQSVLKGIVQGMAWAFAFWGGDFYTFTAPGSATIVNRFNPADGSIVTVATRPDLIVGAGVSTCAPAQ